MLLMHHLPFRHLEVVSSKESVRKGSIMQRLLSMTEFSPLVCFIVLMSWLSPQVNQQVATDQSDDSIGFV
jgi:hypothetical protein